MLIIDRLKLELANKQYFTDVEYNIFLHENDLLGSNEYTQNSKRALLSTVVDVMQALSNDIDRYCKIETEFTTVSSAIENLTRRIQSLKNQIASIDAEGKQDNSTFSFMFHGG